MAGEDNGGGVDLTTPVETLPGDDVVIVPEPTPQPRSRRRWLAIAIAALAIVAIAIVVALIPRGHSKANVVTSPPPSVAPTIAPTHHATPVAPKQHVAPKPVSPPPQQVVAPPVSQPPVVSTPKASTPARTAPPQPKSYPLSALQWTGPTAFTMQHGTTKTIDVSAHNPTDGTITLPVPLSCTPTLDNSSVCAQMAQVLSAGQTASASYTIDARTITPGTYKLTIEGARTIVVTVT
jgi:hypothetical protein